MKNKYNGLEKLYQKGMRPTKIKQVDESLLLVTMAKGKESKIISILKNDLIHFFGNNKYAVLAYKNDIK